MVYVGGIARVSPWHISTHKSHCFTVRLTIFHAVSHQTLNISLQNWGKGNLIILMTLDAMLMLTVGCGFFFLFARNENNQECRRRERRRSYKLKQIYS